MAAITERSRLRPYLVASVLALLIAFTLSRPEALVRAAVEDLTTWTEVDGGTDITISSTTVTVDTMSVNAVSYVYEDQGVGQIGDFVHRFRLNVSALGASAVGGVWGVGNTLGTQSDCQAGNDCFRMLAFNGTGSFDLRLSDDTDDTNDTALALSLSTEYYIEVERAGTTLTGTICAVSYECGTPFDTISTTVPTTTFRYAYALQSRDSGGSDTITHTVSHVDLDPPVDSITITSHANGAKLQRVISTNDKLITLSGTYSDTSGDPTAIEYRWDGGAWLTLENSPTGSTFSGNVTLAAGQGALEVRMADDTAVADDVADFGIGDIFLIAGQSNAVLPATNAQTYSGSLGSAYYRLDDAWTTGAADPSHSGGGGLSGSPWPLVANQIESAENTPVFFISAAEGGTNLSTTPFDWTDGQTSFDTAAAQAITDSGVDDVLAVLWHQGESDATAVVTQATHNAALDTLLTELRAEGTTLSNVDIIAASIGERATPTSLNEVREAIHEAWDDNAGIHPGPVLYDVNLTVDGLHFRTDAEVGILADRWFEAISDVYYGGTQSSPTLTNLVYSIDLLTVTATFDQNVTVADASATAWDLVDNSGNIDANITDIAASTNTITITVSPAMTLPITLSLGDNEDAGGATVPLATGADTLPARSFVNETVFSPDFAAVFTVVYNTHGAPAFSDSLAVTFLALGLLPLAIIGGLFIVRWMRPG